MYFINSIFLICGKYNFLVIFVNFESQGDSSFEIMELDGALNGALHGGSA